MRDTLTIGRIAGIRFGVSWTWVIVFALIVWTLARGVAVTAQDVPGARPIPLDDILSGVAH